MIQVESLLYKLDMKLNKVAVLEHQVIPLENKILALNEAQLKLVKVKVDPNNPLNIGFDANKKRYEDLENLVEDMGDHPLVLTQTDAKLNEWSAGLDGLTPRYMFYVDAYVVADKGDCKDKVLYVNKGLAKHADILTLLANSSWRPSFEYEETFSVVSNFNISVYTDGTFIPTKIYVSYLRYPQTIDYPGYVHFDGTDSVKSDSELHHYLEDELLNFAVSELAMDTENMPAVQMTQERIKTSE
jgi:hypothetical protein